MERRCKPMPIGVETREDGSLHIVGYGAVFYDGTPGTEYRLFDDLVERIMPTAFNRAIQSDDVRGLFNHDTNFVLGRVKSGTMVLTVDGKGLRYDILVPNTQAGRDVAESVRRGDVTGSSFSFIPLTTTWRHESGLDICEVGDVQLFDVGPVTFPAYEATTAGVAARDASEIEKSRAQWRDEQVRIHAAVRAREIRLKELDGAV